MPVDPDSPGSPWAEKIVGVKRASNAGGGQAAVGEEAASRAKVSRATLGTGLGDGVAETPHPGGIYGGHGAGGKATAPAGEEYVEVQVELSESEEEKQVGPRFLDYVELSEMCGRETGGREGTGSYPWNRWKCRRS